jgi:hypothetical protein
MRACCCAALILLVIAMMGSTPASAGGLGAAGQFAALSAEGEVNFGSGAHLSPGAPGKVGGRTVALGNGCAAGGSVVAAAASGDAIRAGNGAHIQGRCATGGGQVAVGNGGGCGGGQDIGGQDPLLAELNVAGSDAAAFAASLGNQNPTQSLSAIDLPGNGQAVIALAAGFNIVAVPFIAAGDGATITVTGGADSAAVINVAGDLRLGSGASVVLIGGLTPEELIFNLGGDARLGNGVKLNGAVLASAGKCIAGNAMKLTGAFFCTLAVSVRNGALINFAGPFLLPNLYVANLLGGPSKKGSVTEYPAFANGNVAPVATIAGPSSGTDNTLIFHPFDVALDSKGNIYVANFGGGPIFPGCGLDGCGSITEYKVGSNGNVAPIARIAGDKTRLANPAGIVLDPAGNIFVANSFGGPARCSSFGCGSVTEYKAGSNGNVAPIATIAAPSSGLDNTMLSGPRDLTLDSGGNIFVVNQNGGPFGRGSVTVYPKGSNGNAGPLALITAPPALGDKTQLMRPSGIALDAKRDIFVTNETGGGLFQGAVTEYKAGSNGNVAPIAAIASPFGSDNTQLHTPDGIALDSGGHIFVTNFNGGPADVRCANFGCGSVERFARGVDGNATPVAIIAPPFGGPDKPQLGKPPGIAVGP